MQKRWLWFAVFNPGEAGVQKRCSVFNPGPAGVQKRWLAALTLTFGYMGAGCMMVAGLDEHTSVPTDTSNPTSKDPGEAGILGDSAAIVDSGVAQIPSDSGTDAKVDSDASDAALSCPPFSCKPGCGPCAAGLKCHAAGDYVCGSPICEFVEYGGGGTFNCFSGTLRSVYTCTPDGGADGGINNDVMPNCIYRGTGYGSRWYCCQ